jgi:hypothetical protein
MFYTSTQNYKGGVNNLYIAEYYNGLHFLATGTSLKSMEQAVKNCKRNYKRLSFKVLGF